MKLPFDKEDAAAEEESQNIYGHWITTWNRKFGYHQANEGISPRPVYQFYVQKRQNPFWLYLNLFVITVACFVLFSQYFLKINQYFYGALATLFLIAVYKLQHFVCKESVLAITTVGVQIEQVNSLGRMTFVQFVPSSNIKALVINETIRRQRVITYLALLLKGPDSYGRVIVPIFKETLPRLNVLTKVYREMQEILETS